MQHLVWQRWLDIRRRVSAESEPVLARLSARRSELGLAVALGIFFMIAGGLSPRVALLGLAAAAVWAALWPSDATDRVARAGASGQPSLGNDGAWHMVVDAVPEPAIVLDGAGYVMHANRMAEDLFGARRRGGHVASMSRDPELLEAVDKALASGETAAVELHERVPVERRLLATVAPLERSRSGCGRSLAPHLVSRPERAGPARAECARTSSPTPAMSSEPRWPRSGDSSRRCKARPRTTPRRASASSRS